MPKIGCVWLGGRPDESPAASDFAAQTYADRELVAEEAVAASPRRWDALAYWPADCRFHPDYLAELAGVMFAEGAAAVALSSAFHRIAVTGEAYCLDRRLAASSAVLGDLSLVRPSRYRREPFNAVTAAASSGRVEVLRNAPWLAVREVPIRGLRELRERYGRCLVEASWLSRRLDRASHELRRYDRLGPVKVALDWAARPVLVVEAQPWQRQGCPTPSDS